MKLPEKLQRAKKVMDKLVRILYLENNPTYEQLIREALLTHNVVYQLCVVGSSAEFSKALMDFSPNLILTGHSVLSFSCNEALAISRQSSNRIPFIIIASALSEEYALELVGSGADDYIFIDRLGRLPVAIHQALEKFQHETERTAFVNESVISENRYRALIENSTDAVVILDKEGKPTYVSEAVTKILGYSRQEIMQMDLFSIMHPDDLMATAIVLEKVLVSPGIPIKGHTGQMLHKDGRWRWIEAIVTNCLHDPAINGIVDNFRDISDRKSADLLLYESEQFNKSILSSLTSHIAVINNLGVIITVNKAWDDFAKANQTAPLEHASKGSNYFEACQNAIAEGVTDAAKALAGIHSVFQKKTDLFELEYPCHSPIEKRWYILRVMHFGEDDSRVVISHQNITVLKATEEKLVLSQSRLNQAQAIAKIGSWEADLTTYQLIWSEETYRIFDTTADNFSPTYQRFLALIHPEDRKMVDTAIRNSIKENIYHSIEHRIVTADGIEKVVEERWKIIKSDQGAALRVSGTCQEITQRKKTAELVITSQANLNAIIENTDAFIYSLDRNFCYITFNSRLGESMKNLYGINIRPGYNIFEFIKTFDPGGVQEWDEIYSRALKGETVNFEREFHVNDCYTYTRFSINPMWKDHTVIGLSCYVNDITSEKQASEKDKFQANLLDTIGQAAIATDLKGHITFWNKAAELIYGWNACEALHQNSIELTTATGSRAQARETMALLMTGQSWSGELTGQRKDGSHFPASITNSPVYDQHKKLSGSIGICSDITEKKALEERLDSTSALARIGNYEIDLVKNMLFWSPLTRQIYEVSNEFIPTIENALKFFTEGYCRNTITQAYFQARDKGTAFDLDLQILTAAGNQRWIRVIGQSECIQGACIRIFGSLQDITKIKTAELEVLKVYEEKNVVLESIGDAFFAVDQNWTISYWNSMAVKVLGKTKAQTLGYNLWDVFPDAIGSGSYVNYQQAIDTNQAVHFEDYYPPLEKWYEVSAYPSANVLSVYFKDITQRKQTQSALEESERNYSGLFHLSPLPMWVFDLETLQFLDANQAALGSYGYSLDEFRTMTIKDIVLHQDSTSAKLAFEIEKDSGQKLDIQGILTHKKKDGTLMQVEIQSNLIRYHGKPAKIVIATDMTERYNYIHAIEGQNIKLREIAWIQSHIVRAPLARIMGLIPMIKDTDAYIDERETMLDYMLIAAHELDDAIKSISDKTYNGQESVPVQ